MSSSGLSYRKTSEAIGDFVSQEHGVGPRHAVFCTYDLEPDRFEAVIMPELQRRGSRFRTLVLADAGALQRDDRLKQRAAASCYELAPVRVNGQGVFHPKMVLLRAGSNVLIGVGSANLTRGGLGGNLEMMLFMQGNTEEGKALASSAFGFLEDLRKSDKVAMPAPAKRFLERVCVLAPNLRQSRAQGPVHHNLETPLIERIRQQRPTGVKRAAIMSPWHSTQTSDPEIEPRVVSVLTEAMGARPVVHTEGSNRKAPALGRTEVRVLRVTEPESDDETDGDDAGSPRPIRHARLHAKAYLAVGSKQARLWFGSANCTTPALLLPTGRGNVELLISVDLDRSSARTIEADLESKFEPSLGALPVGKPSRIPKPRGQILAAYLSEQAGQCTLTVELAPLPTTHTLCIGRSSAPKNLVKKQVGAGQHSVTLSETESRRLLGAADSPPSLLWEHAGKDPIPFPVSTPLIQADGTGETVLEDLLDDLAGRPTSGRKTLPRSPGQRQTDRDKELESLSKSDHAGKLDRIAVRVELLRRRLESIQATEAQRAHYQSILDKLDLPTSNRALLKRHLALRSPSR